MATNYDSNILPGRRFKDDNGNDYSEWEKYKIDQIARINPPSEALPDDFIYIDLESVKNGRLSKINSLDKREAPSRARRLLVEGDVLFQTVRPYQKNHYYFSEFEQAYVASTGFAQLRAKEGFSSSFIYYLLFSDDFSLQVDINCTGSNYPAINSAAIKTIKAKVPSIPEQEKIAKFLSLLDERISKQEKKIELLEQLKKGYMQKIFSQELRFRDDNGNEYPEWESTNLGELIEVGKAGGTPSTTVPSYYEGNIPFLSISDMTDQGKYIENTTKFISDSGLNNSAAWVVPSDYLLYAMYASVGKVSISKNKMATSQAIFAARFTEVVTVEYMYYYLTYFQKFLSRYITIGTQGNINAKTLKSFSIIYPHQKEQLKIVQLLSNLDELIAVENKKKCLLGSEKDSYLKQLFI